MIFDIDIGQQWISKCNVYKEITYGRSRMIACVEIYHDTKEVVVDENATVDDLLKALDLHPDSFLVFKDGRPLPLDSDIGDGKGIKVIRVASGG